MSIQEYIWYPRSFTPAAGLAVPATQADDQTAEEIRAEKKDQRKLKRKRNRANKKTRKEENDSTNAPSNDAEPGDEDEDEDEGDDRSNAGDGDHEPSNDTGDDAAPHEGEGAGDGDNAHASDVANDGGAANDGDAVGGGDDTPDSDEPTAGQSVDHGSDALDHSAAAGDTVIPDVGGNVGTHDAANGSEVAGGSEAAYQGSSEGRRVFIADESTIRVFGTTEISGIDAQVPLGGGLQQLDARTSPQSSTSASWAASVMRWLPSRSWLALDRKSTAVQLAEMTATVERHNFRSTKILLQLSCRLDTLEQAQGRLQASDQIQNIVQGALAPQITTVGNLTTAVSAIDVRVTTLGNGLATTKTGLGALDDTTRKRCDAQDTDLEKAQGRLTALEKAEGPQQMMTDCSEQAEEDVTGNPETPSETVKTTKSLTENVAEIQAQTDKLAGIEEALSKGWAALTDLRSDLQNMFNVDFGHLATARNIISEAGEGDYMNTALNDEVAGILDKFANRVQATPTAERFNGEVAQIIRRAVRRADHFVSSDPPAQLSRSLRLPQSTRIGEALHYIDRASTAGNARSPFESRASEELARAVETELDAFFITARNYELHTELAGVAYLLYVEEAMNRTVDLPILRDMIYMMFPPNAVGVDSDGQPIYIFKAMAWGDRTLFRPERNEQRRRQGTGHAFEIWERVDMSEPPELMEEVGDPERETE